MFRPSSCPENPDRYTVGSMEVTRHEPVFTSHNNLSALIRETAAIHVLEGERGHYLGTMTGQLPNVVHLMEAHGIRVYSLVQDGASFDAFSVWHGEVPFAF